MTTLFDTVLEMARELQIVRDCSAIEDSSSVTVKTHTFDFTAAVATDYLTVAQNEILMSRCAVTVASTGTLPGGLSAGTTYFVQRINSTTIQLSTDPGGTYVVNITTTGSGTHTLTYVISNTIIKDQNAEFGPDEFRRGTLFILTGNNENTFYLIKQHSGDAFTIEDPGYSVLAGTRFAVAARDIPLDVLLAGLNDAIRKVGYTDVDDSSLITVYDQEIYDLPAGVTDLLTVEVAQDDAEPYDYYVHTDWKEQDGDLYFMSNRPATDDYPIRLTYLVSESDLQDESEEIPATINYKLMFWTAILYCAKYGMKVHGVDPKRNWPSKMQEAQVMIQRYQQGDALMKTPRLPSM